MSNWPPATERLITDLKEQPLPGLREADKIFTCAWISEREILTGGKDNKVLKEIRYNFLIPTDSTLGCEYKTVSGDSTTEITQSAARDSDWNAYNIHQQQSYYGSM